MIFDTDVLIWASRGNLAAARAIDSVAERGISAVSLMELLRGSRSRFETHGIRRMLLQLKFTIVPLSEDIGATATGIIEQYALSHGIHVADALIAATAIKSSQSLCSGNIKRFRPIRSLLLTVFRANP